MIHNGHDYIPYSSVVSMESPGTLYIYYSLGAQTDTITVDSTTEHITNVDIALVDSTVYAFVDI